MIKKSEISNDTDGTFPRAAAAAHPEGADTLLARAGEWLADDTGDDTYVAADALIRDLAAALRARTEAK